MTTRNILLLDLGIAISAALIVLAITPGPAAAGLIAIIVLVAGVISFRRNRGANDAPGPDRAARSAAMDGPVRAPVGQAIAYERALSGTLGLNRIVFLEPSTRGWRRARDGDARRHVGGSCIGTGPH